MNTRPYLTLLYFTLLYFTLLTFKEHVQSGHGTSDKLVYCHEALHLQEKLQKAGYKPPVAKWDSDSESDEDSDDEADLCV